MYELEKGVATVTQSDEFFDCLPAIRAAFNFTKVFTNNGVDEEEQAEIIEFHCTKVFTNNGVNDKAESEKIRDEEEKKKTHNELQVIKAPTRKVEKTLEYEEFRMFLQTLRQYYLYCQVAIFQREKYLPNNLSNFSRLFIIMMLIPRKISRKKSF